MIRTSLQEEQLGDAETVRAYKSLARVERAFRSLKSLLAVRPVFHWTQRRVRAHLLICMLAYYLEWHMRERLAPLLFLDEDRQEGKTGPVGPAVRSEQGKRKDRTRETLEGNLPLQSFPDLLAHLTTLSALELRLEAAPEHRVSKLSALTPFVVFQFVSVDFTKLFHELVRSLFELVHYCRRELRPGKRPCRTVCFSQARHCNSFLQ